MSIADKLTQITENEQRVFNAGESKGYEKGYTEGINKGGYADGYEEGKKAECDTFWNNFQDNGKRVDYTYAFSRTWFDEIFKPKHNIAPTNADHMFFSGKMTTEGFKAAIEKGVTFDFSKATLMAYAFASMANLVEIPFDVSLEGATSANNTNGAFSYNTNLETIKKIILKSDGTNPLDPKIFASSPKIKNITFEGIIANSLNMGHCTYLSVDSIKNIIEHLSPNVSGKTLTLSQAAVDKANASGAFDGISANVHGAMPLSQTTPTFTMSLNAGERVKVTLEVEEGHHYNDFGWGTTLNPTDWYVGMGFGGEPYWREKIIEGGKEEAYGGSFYITIWYATGGEASFNYNVRIVRVDADGNEIDGENLYNIPEGTYSTYDGVEYEIKKTSLESLIANKNWTLNFG